MHKYSIHMKWSTALLKEPIIYSWGSVDILQNNYLCILQKKESHKGLKQHERVFSALLHCGLIVFHWKQFQHSSRFKHFLRTFPSVLLRNIKLLFLRKTGWSIISHLLQTTKCYKWKWKSIHIIRNVPLYVMSFLEQNPQKIKYTTACICFKKVQFTQRWQFGHHLRCVHQNSFS